MNDFSELFDNWAVRDYKPSNDGIIQGHTRNYVVENRISEVTVPWRTVISCDANNRQSRRVRCRNCPFSKYDGTYTLQISPRQPFFFDLIRTRNLSEIERIGKLVGLQRGLCRTYQINILKDRIVRIYSVKEFNDGSFSSPFAVFSIAKDDLPIRQLHRLFLNLCSDGEGRKAFVCVRAEKRGLDTGASGK